MITTEIIAWYNPKSELIRSLEDYADLAPNIKELYVPLGKLPKMLTKNEIYLLSNRHGFVDSEYFVNFVKDAILEMYR